MKAILCVRMWGNLLDTYEFDNIAQGDLDGQVRPMFYDAAHALGSFDDEAIAPGTATCFSIAATKPVSAGEGGLVYVVPRRVCAGLRGVQIGQSVAIKIF